MGLLKLFGKWTPTALLVAGIGGVNPVISKVPQLDTDELLKPLRDSQVAPSGRALPFQGNVSKQVQFSRPQINKQPDVLKIQVKTFQEAVVLEKAIDWYGWYLSFRGYIDSTGGLNQCMVGTPIKIHKRGHIEALSPDPRCRLSVAWRRFPLPSETSLDALILPVRSGKLPPASQQELHNRIRQQSRSD